MGPGSPLAFARVGRDDDRLVRAKHQPAAVRNRARRNFIVSGLLLTMTFATQTCWAPGALCVTPYVTHDLAPSVLIPCAIIRRHPDVSLSVVMMCLCFEAPMSARRIHINPPPGPRPR